MPHAILLKLLAYKGRMDDQTIMPRPWWPVPETGLEIPCSGAIPPAAARWATAQSADVAEGTVPQPASPTAMSPRPGAKHLKPCRTVQSANARHQLGGLFRGEAL